MKKTVSCAVLFIMLWSTMTLAIPVSTAQSAYFSGKLQLTTSPYSDQDPAWSPDGKTIVYSAEDSSKLYRHIWVMQADGSEKQQLTTGLVVDTSPTYSPDGSQIAFTRFTNFEIHDLYLMDADGTDLQLLHAGDLDHWNPKWSHDGTRLAYTYGGAGSETYDIRILTLDGKSEETVLSSDYPGMTVDWAPDDSQLVYSMPDGIWLVDTASPYQKTPLYTADDPTHYPVFSPEGQYVLFAQGPLGEQHDLFLIDAKGSFIDQLTDDTDIDSSLDWSADGDMIAYGAGPIGEEDCWRARLVVNVLAPTVVNLALIPLETSDQTISYTLADFEDIAVKLVDYYREVSYGAIVVNAEVLRESDGSWFTLPESVVWYAGHDMNRFFEDAIDNTDPVDYRRYDNDDAQGIGIPAFIPPQDIFGRGAFIWDDHKVDGRYPVTDDGTSVDVIYVHEPRFRNVDKVIRGLAHEFAHALGKLLITRNLGTSQDGWWLLPDLYYRGDRLNTHPSDLDREWALMGALNRDFTRERVHLCAVSKAWLGWLNYLETSIGETLTIPILPRLGYKDDVPVYRFTDPDGTEHYYVLEARSNLPSMSDWDTESRYTHTLAFYLVDIRPDTPNPLTDVVNLADHAENAFLDYDDPAAGVTFDVLAVNDYSAEVSVEVYHEAELAGVMLNTWASILSTIRPLVPHEAISDYAVPDIDLHAYDEAGRHVGVNYATGEYERQIPEALTSGDLINGREWIFVPADIPVNYVVDARDNAVFFEQFPELLDVVENSETYTMSLTYYDPNENRYDSTPILDTILPDEEVQYSATIVENPDGTFTPMLALPTLSVLIPREGQTLQDGVTLRARAWDETGVEVVTFSIRLPNGGFGTVISPEFENLPATPVSPTLWELPFDTAQLPDGYYVTYVEAIDTTDNRVAEVVNFSIRNWATVDYEHALPASESNKAGRTLPIKFTLRVDESVDPEEPFVYNEDLTILIYDRADPAMILQTSTFGDTRTDYRIDALDELYITNFTTSRTPATYIVEIYRSEQLLGSFQFITER